MRKNLKITLLVFLMTILLFPFSVSAENSLQNNLNAYGTTDDIGIAPEYYLPFVYEEDFLFSDQIDCTQCRPGYLYVANLEKHTVKLIVDEPVCSFTETNEFLFYINNNNEIIRTDYSGKNHIKLYTAKKGQLASVEYYNNHLFFLDGNHIVDMNLADNSIAIVTELENATSIVPYDQNTLYIRDDTSEIFSYNTKTKAIVKIVDEDSYVNTDHSHSITDKSYQPNNYTSIEPAALDNQYYNLPLQEYPAGSYFTNDGTPCVNHNNCRRYAKTNQCDGLARYAHEKYNHVAGSAWSDPYEPAGDTRTAEQYFLFQSDSSLRNYFNLMSKGAYVRMSKYDRANDSNNDGSHSFVYVSHNTSGATLYEANRDDRCGVEFHFRTFANIRAAYPYGFKRVSHTYSSTGFNISTDYHRVPCTTTNCAAYIVERHTNVATPTGHICTVCGSTTGSGTISPG